MSPVVRCLLLLVVVVVQAKGYFCECFEDNIAYMGNNIVMGVENMQPSRDACQKSCQDNPECDFWTWGKSGPTKGRCYLKDARENITPNDDYMSGSKRCKILDNPGGKWKPFPGTAQRISVGQAGVFIIDQNHQVKEKKGENWTAVKGGDDAADISVGQQKIWVVMKNETIFTWESSWEKVRGSLTNVCVNGKDDKEVWGVNKYEKIYKFTNGHWIWVNPIFGWLKQITCGEAGVWGINPLGNLYSHGNGGFFGWSQVQTDGNTFTWISSGLNGEVWAVDENGTVFKSGSGHEWKEVPGKKMRQIDVFNGTVWGVDSNNKIWSTTVLLIRIFVCNE